MNLSTSGSNRTHSVALALALSCILPGVCHGASVVNSAALLTRDGNSLVVTLNNPVVFNTTSNVTGSSYGFLMPDAINIAGTGGFFVSSDPATALTLLGSMPGIALMRGGARLEILFYLPSSVTLPVGTEVTLSSGVVRLPNFFNSSIIQGIKNSEIPLVIFSNSSGGAISAPTEAIPEPTTALYLVGASLLAFARRKHAR